MSRYAWSYETHIGCWIAMIVFAGAVVWEVVAMVARWVVGWARG